MQYSFLFAIGAVQSWVGGRDGSNACTVISCVVARDVLSRRLACLELVSSVVDSITRPFLQCIIEGNALYDSLDYNRLLACDEAIEKVAAANLSIVRDIFAWLPAHWQQVADTLIPASGSVTAEVVVQTPTSVALCGTATSLVVFDSHAHDNHGASVTVIRREEAVQHLCRIFWRGLAHFHLLRLANM